MSKLFLILFGILLVSMVHAQTISSCQTINESGSYDLISDLSSGSSDYCIKIVSSNVSIDGNGFRLDMKRAINIDGVKNVSISNMKMYSGQGILSNYSNFTLFENLTIHSSFNCLYAYQNDYLFMKNVLCNNVVTDFGLTELDDFDKDGIGILLLNNKNYYNQFLSANINNISISNFHVGFYLEQSTASEISNVSISNARDSGMILSNVMYSGFHNISISDSSKGIMGYFGTENNLFEDIFLSEITNVWLFSKSKQLGDALYPLNNFSRITLDNQYGALNRNTYRDGTMSAVLIASRDYTPDTFRTLYLGNQSVSIQDMFDYPNYVLSITPYTIEISPLTILGTYARDLITFKGISFYNVAIDHDGADLDLKEYTFSHGKFSMELPITPRFYKIYNGIYSSNFYKVSDSSARGLALFIGYLTLIMKLAILPILIVIVVISILSAFKILARMIRNAGAGSP